MKYTLPNGELAAVITKSKKFTGEFDCLLCSAYNLRVPNLIQHVNGRRHLQKVDLVDVETDKAPLHALPRFKGKIFILFAESLIRTEMISSVKKQRQSLQR